MTRFVLLLRGINVGGNHKVKMSDLKELLESLKFTDVLPYIQSGNVVFKSDNANVAQLQPQIEIAFEQKFGFHVAISLRTSAELSEIIEKNPFQGQSDKDQKWIAVLFLATQPTDAAQEDLLKTYVGPEEIFISGTEAYIYYTNGIGRSKLSHSFLEKKLKTSGTVRNWNTVLRLQELI